MKPSANVLLMTAAMVVAWSLLGPSPVSSAPPSATGNGFVEVEVARLLDTRPDGTTVDGLSAGDGPVAAGGFVEFEVRGRAGVPVDVIAVAVTVTVTESAADGYATVYPCGAVPIASTVNHRAGQTVANSAITALSPEGRLCVHSMSRSHIVLDITGAFDAGFVPVANARLLDTRPGEPTGDGAFAGSGLVPADGVVEVQVAGRSGVPVGATAAALTVTTTGSTRAGFVSVYPCSSRPLASTLNHTRGESRANSLVAQLDPNGRVCLFTLGASHLVVDVSGYVPAGSPYTPVVPSRLADTRFDEPSSDGRCTSVGRVATGTSMVLTVAGRGGVPATGVGAVALNVVATGSKRPGFVTAHRPGAGVPTASMLNYLAAETVASSVIAPVDAQGRVSLFSNVGAHLVVDVIGWLPGPSTSTPAVACTGTFVDPRQHRQLVVQTSDRTGCALMGSNAIECWITGMLGNRLLSGPGEPYPDALVEIAGAAGDLCLLRAAGTVSCSFGPLGAEVPLAGPVTDIVGFGASDGFCAIAAGQRVFCWTSPPSGGEPLVTEIVTSGPAKHFVPLSYWRGPIAVVTASGTADVVVPVAGGRFQVAWTSSEAVPGHPWSTVVSAAAGDDGVMCLVLVDGRATCGASGDLAPELDVEWNAFGVVRAVDGTSLSVGTNSAVVVVQPFPYGPLAPVTDLATCWYPLTSDLWCAPYPF